MKKFAIFSFFLFLLFSAKAQDKIISVNQDTIHCKIVSINDERIFYELKNDDGSVTGKFIQLSQVAEYSSSHLLDSKSGIKQKTPKTRNIPEKPFCLSLNVGGSTMPWYLDYFQSSSSIPDFYDKLEKGFHINADMHYMINDFLGLGAEYSFFKTSASGSLLSVYSSSIFLVGSEKCRQYINYLGASVLFRQYLDANHKFTVSESLSGGILFLRFEDQNIYPFVDQSIYSDNSNNLLLTGNSFSGKLGLTFEYKLFKAMSVGLGGNFIWCSLKKANIESKGSNEFSYSNDNQKLAKTMRLSRIDYSFVLRYSL
jgi:hypothetical protein